MSSIWGSEFINLIISLIAGEVVDKLVIDNVLVKFNKEKIKTKILKIVKVEFSNSFSIVSGFSSEVNGENFYHFLNQPIVLHEILKIIHPIYNPNIDLISEEWNKFFGEPIQGSTKLFVELFLKNVRKGLFDEEEFFEILHMKETHEGFGNITKDIAKIKDEISNLNSRFEDKDENREVPKEEEIYHTQLDNCKNLLIKNYPRAALALLKDLENELSTNYVSNYLRFRLITLIGGCELKLRNENYAISLYKSALNLMPEYPSAIGNASLAYLIDDQIELAIEFANKAIEKDGKKNLCTRCSSSGYCHPAKFSRFG